jgi:hypothetical protein
MFFWIKWGLCEDLSNTSLSDWWFELSSLLSDWMSFSVTHLLSVLCSILGLKDGAIFNLKNYKRQWCCVSWMLVPRSRNHLSACLWKWWTNIVNWNWNLSSFDLDKTFSYQLCSCSLSVETMSSSCMLLCFPSFYLSNLPLKGFCNLPWDLFLS